MWPAVPRIMTCSQTTILPELQRAQRPSIGEMLREELAQQPLVRARRGVVERWRMPSLDELAQRIARVGRQLAPRGGESPAAETERAAGPVAEHHRAIRGERGM